jgi:putative addiction module component (TIGR02574 family)
MARLRCDANARSILPSAAGEEPARTPCATNLAPQRAGAARTAYWDRLEQSDTLVDMSDADIAEILKLPVEERLRLVELIWDSIATNPSAVPLSDAHRAAIDERLAEHARDPDDVLTRDEVLAAARRG